MKITLYTTHCPRCKVLEQKLEQKGIPYTEFDNVSEMLSLGIKSVPVMRIDQGEPMNYKAAIDWINTYNGGL